MAHSWTSLVVQWIRILPPGQRSQVRPLIQEDSTHLRAIKPVCHNYWVCALQSHEQELPSPHGTTTETRVSRACAPQRENVLHHNEQPLTMRKSSHRLVQLEKAAEKQRRPSAAKNKEIKKTKAHSWVLALLRRWNFQVYKIPAFNKKDMPLWPEWPLS